MGLVAAAVCIEDAAKAVVKAAVNTLSVTVIVIVSVASLLEAIVSIVKEL